MRHRLDRPLDISFVIDALVNANMAAAGLPHDPMEALSLPDEFSGVPDTDHIGVLGHSFGAFAAHAVGGAVFAPTMGVREFRDPRVDAIVVIAPQGKDRYGCFDKGEANNSWTDVVVPSYVIVGGRDLPDWRRRPFDRYPATGNKFLTIGKAQSHSGIAGYGDPNVRRFIDLNTALFLHTYLRGGKDADRIGQLSSPNGWKLERK
jgi:hypothetical protein